MIFWNFPDLFLCPCHEMAGSYSVTLFRHFVLLSFCHHSLSNHYINNLCMHQLKFDIWMYLINIKAEFKVGFGPMIVDRLMPLELWKKNGKFTFRSLSQQPLHTFKFGSCPMIFDRVVPLELEKWKILSFHSLTFEGVYIISWYFRCRLFTRKYRYSLNLVSVQWFLTQLCLLNLGKNGKFLVSAL